MTEPEEPTEPEEVGDAPIKPANSFYEVGSVGKIYFNFAKPVDSRWKRLY